MRTTPDSNSNDDRAEVGDHGKTPAPFDRCRQRARPVPYRGGLFEAFQSGELLHAAPKSFQRDVRMRGHQPGGVIDDRRVRADREFAAARTHRDPQLSCNAEPIPLGLPAPADPGSTSPQRDDAVKRIDHQLGGPSIRDWTEIDAGPLGGSNDREPGKRFGRRQLDPL